MKGQSPYKKNLRLIGGGHSHVAVIKQLGMRPIPGIRTTLISHDTHTPYSGMLPGLIAGHYSFDDCHIDLRKLCQWAGIQFIRSEVIHLDPIANKIVCHHYPPLRYDLLSINTGSQPALDTIKGAINYGHAVKPVKQFLENWSQWLSKIAMSKTTQHVVVIGGGAAGVEIVLAMHYKLHEKTSINAQFTLICADKSILISHNQRVQTFFQHHMRSLGITIINNRHVISISENQLLLDNNDTLNYDFAAWAVNAGAQSWPRESGLQCNKKGFIQVDQFLRSISHPSIFAVGDSAAFTPTPLPKAGVYAVRQGPILVKNIYATFKQNTLKPFRPQQHFLSLLTLGGRNAVASKGFFFSSGKWVWHWKNHIDRAFMARFSPTPMTVSNSVNNAGNLAMRCGGCGAKVSNDILKSVLAELNIQPNKDVVNTQNDDAAIINPPSGMQWLQSVDFFRSFIDDPYLLGQIAATHCLGDIYAMGGTPHSALATAIIPYSHPSIMHETLLHIMQGVLNTLNDENTTLIGGHSGEGPEIAIGLTINGTLVPGSALTKSGLKPSDHLILTKPIGSGVLLAANMVAHCQGAWLDQALAYMLQSNRAAATILRAAAAHSCTDITGFGLLGHLQEMLIASHCSATITLNEIPLMIGAESCSLQGVQSTLFTANKASSQCQNYAGQHPCYALLFDPQTAGGLLAGVPSHHTNECLQALKNAGYTAAQIGMVNHYNPDALITLIDV